AFLQNLVGAGERLIQSAAPERKPCPEHAHRPFVPAARFAAVGAVSIAGAGEKITGRVVAPAHQVNLGQSVEHRSGRFMELNRASDVEGAMEGLFRAAEIPESNAN